MSVTLISYLLYRLKCIILYMQNVIIFIYFCFEQSVDIECYINIYLSSDTPDSIYLKKNIDCKVNFVYCLNGEKFIVLFRKERNVISK